MLSVQQKVFVVKCFYESKNYHTVRTLFRKKFGTKNSLKIPNRKQIFRLVHKFESKGYVNFMRSKVSDGYMSQASQQRINNIKNFVEVNPRTSVRKASQALNLPKSTIHRTLRKTLNLKPYRIQFRQELKADDPNKRLNFAYSLLRKPVCFTKKIYFSDEATFSLDGQVNKHNVRIWGSERPDSCLQIHARNSPKVHVFCLMSYDKIIGPYFFDDVTVKGSDYQNMLENWLFPKLPTDERFIFQQDGAPPHWALKTREFLNDRLPHRWIGRSSTKDLSLLPWPPRSPDLTPLDFFLWGFIKDEVYVIPQPKDIEEIKSRVVEAIDKIGTALLARVHESFRERLSRLVKTKGLHIENK